MLASCCFKNWNQYASFSLRKADCRGRKRMFTIQHLVSLLKAQFIAEVFSATDKQCMKKFQLFLLRGGSVGWHNDPSASGSYFLLAKKQIRFFSLPLLAAAPTCREVQAKAVSVPKQPRKAAPDLSWTSEARKNSGIWALGGPSAALSTNRTFEVVSKTTLSHLGLFPELLIVPLTWQCYRRLQERQKLRLLF